MASPQPDVPSSTRFDRNKLVKLQHQCVGSGKETTVTTFEYELVSPTKEIINDVPEDYESPIYDAEQYRDNSRWSTVTGILFNIILTILPLPFIGTRPICQWRGTSIDCEYFCHSMLSACMECRIQPVARGFWRLRDLLPPYFRLPSPLSLAASPKHTHFGELNVVQR
jgi:hypothetical protein